MFAFMVIQSLGRHTALLLQAMHGDTAINWSPHHVSHSATECIHPAPVGNQCMLRATDAVATCMNLAGCHSLLCPDEPMRKHGKYCLARGVEHVHDPLVSRHPMCFTGGKYCTTFFFHHVAAKAASGTASSDRVDFRRADHALALLVPGGANLQGPLAGLNHSDATDVPSAALTLEAAYAADTDTAALIGTLSSAGSQLKLFWVPKHNSLAGTLAFN